MEKQLVAECKKHALAEVARMNGLTYMQIYRWWEKRGHRLAKMDRYLYEPYRQAQREKAQASAH